LQRWRASREEDVADDSDEDDYLNPSQFSENLKKKLPLVAVVGSWALVALIFLGVFLWLHFTGDHIMEEVRAHRPQMTMLVNALKKAAAGPNALHLKKNQTLHVPDRAVPKPEKSDVVLHPHPDMALVEKTDIGMLPIIAKDGRKSWRVYSRPFNASEKRPRVAVILTGLGVSHNATESAIRDLPPEVSFAFAPHAKKLEEWVKTARDAGHEVLLSVPMEPGDYPRSDPGPYGLLLKLGKEENLQRLHWMMSRLTGYVGVINHQGGRFTANLKAMQPILNELGRRGLMFVDSRTSSNSVAPIVAVRTSTPYAVNDRLVDVIAARAAIDFRLSEIESVLGSKGKAVAIGRAYPVTIQRLKRWIDRLPKKGFVLAPISALAIKPKVKTR
jgi:polysaccharide deacetylase 2 family uncharacterized protein YibQ